MRTDALLTVATPKLLLRAIALIAALLVISTVTSHASAASGGLAPEMEVDGNGNSRAGNGNTSGKYQRLWKKVSRSNKRWARKVAECESGRDPNAVALGGSYRGAFMFTWDAWKTSPKSPGGDPTDYSYKTQAVVAVALKKRDGTGPWPVCG